MRQCERFCLNNKNRDDLLGRLCDFTRVFLASQVVPQ